MTAILSIIATIISSVALIGVALGLMMQARQLRASQIQVMRELHLELIKIAVDNPALVSSIETNLAPEHAAKAVYLNLWLKHLQTGYSLKAISAASVSHQTARMFKTEDARAWWRTGARDTYRIEAEKKAEKEFFTIVDNQFQNATRPLEPSRDSIAELRDKKE